MNLIERLYAVLAPHECLGCGREGTVLCRDCCGRLPAPPKECYRCGASLREGVTGAVVCPPCRTKSRLGGVFAVAVYRGTAKELVGSLKFSFAKAAAADMATCLAARLPVLPSETLICHAPAVPKRIRQRGFDQAELIAKELAAATHLSRQPLLARVGAHRQVGASRQARLEQMHGEFRVRQPNVVKGATILIIDDVLTTGATLEAAASELLAAGAAHVFAAAFAVQPRQKS